MKVFITIVTILVMLALADFVQADFLSSKVAGLVTVVTFYTYLFFMVRYD